MLIRIEQVRKATATLDSLLWSKHIALTAENRMFNTAVESVLCYGCELWTVRWRLKKKLLSTEMGVWRREARTYEIWKVRTEVIREELGIRQTVLERQDNNLSNGVHVA